MRHLESASTTPPTTSPAATVKKLLGSLSAVTEVNDFLWTASDEGRTLQCLQPDGEDGYRLKKPYSLDLIFRLTRKQNAEEPEPPAEKVVDLPEADIESLSDSAFQVRVDANSQKGRDTKISRSPPRGVRRALLRLRGLR